MAHPVQGAIDGACSPVLVTQPPALQAGGPGFGTATQEQGPEGSVFCRVAALGLSVTGHVMRVPQGAVAVGGHSSPNCARSTQLHDVVGGVPADLDS